MKKYLLLAALALCFGALNAGSAQAQTPDTIYACYHKEHSALRKVSGPGQCKKNEIEISWSIVGEPGPKGDKGEPGQSVTSEAIPLGDARCPNGVGGVQYTDSTGVRIVCNGQQGEKGEPGDKGETGDRGPSNAYSDGPNEAILDLNEATVGSLSLPAGKYLVSVSMQLANLSETIGGLVQCYVSYPGSPSPPIIHTAGLKKAGNVDDLGNIQTSSFTLPVELSAAATVDLKCLNFVVAPNTVKARNVFLNALRVGTLERQ